MKYVPRMTALGSLGAICVLLSTSISVIMYMMVLTSGPRSGSLEQLMIWSPILGITFVVGCLLVLIGREFVQVETDKR